MFCSLKSQPSTQEADLLRLHRKLVPPFRISPGGQKINGDVCLFPLFQPVSYVPSIRRITVDSLALPASRKSVRRTVRTRIKCEAKFRVKRMIEIAWRLPVLIFGFEKHSIHGLG
jgi:hypothetical protein